jgi:FxsC-like protein
VPNFFVSSAAGDDDHYVAQFHRDLCARIAALTGDRESEVGFLGTAAAGGRSWPERMATALAQCGVFIALCSPRYFLNHICGRQYWIFKERLRRHERNSGTRSPALIHLMWTPTDAPADSDPMLVRPDDGTAHRGLRRYVRLRGLRPAYEEFLDRLAGQVASVARAHPLPSDPPIPDLADTPSAFAVANPVPVLDAGSTAAGPPGRSRRPSGTGSQHVHFLVAAGSRQEMERIREDLSYYGEAAEDWSPYQPVLAEPLADHAQALAADRMVGSEVAEIGEVLDRIERAGRHNELVVLLVDAWSTQLDPYRRILAEADRRGLGTAAVLVPVNHADAETRRNSDELTFRLRQTFRNSTRRPAAVFRSRIETPDGFAADLAHVLEAARNRLFWEGQVHRLPSGESTEERPILRGP